MGANLRKIMLILRLKWDEFFGMSSDVVELFFFDKYDVLAFKRTIKRVFSIISTPHLISNMLVRWILDFGHIWNFHEGFPKQPVMLRGRSIRFQTAQYSYFTVSNHSWPPISTLHSFGHRILLHKLAEKLILWVFSMASSSSGWVLMSSKIFALKNIDLQQL